MPRAKRTTLNETENKAEVKADISKEFSSVIITEDGQEVISAPKADTQILMGVSSKNATEISNCGLPFYINQINAGIELMKKGIQGRLLIGQALVKIKENEAEFLHKSGYLNFYEYCRKTFKMSRTLVDNCMFFYKNLSYDDPTTGQPVLEDAYKEFNISQLSELRFVEKDQLYHFSPEQTISQMRALKRMINKEKSENGCNNTHSKKNKKGEKDTTTLLKSVCELPEKGNVTAKIRSQIKETLEEIKDSSLDTNQNLKIMICICEEKE